MPRSCFRGSNVGQNWEICLTLHPPLLQPSNPRSNGQTKDLDTTTDLTHKDSSEQTYEPSTDTETVCEPLPQPPSRHSDNPSMLDINNPTAGTIPQEEPSHSRGGKYNLSFNPHPKYSEI